jgi:hypothetical protein
MSDLMFNDIVTTVTIKTDRTRFNPEMKPVACQALCSTCGTYHEVGREELDELADEDTFRYIASMRAWNCCHDEQVPYDGFPEEPDHPRVKSSHSDDETKT